MPLTGFHELDPALSKLSSFSSHLHQGLGSLSVGTLITIALVIPTLLFLKLVIFAMFIVMH
jgi:hypothetical protein